MTTLVESLKAVGFTDDQAGLQAAVQNAEAQGLSLNGRYEVHSVLTKGDVIVTVEQNEAPENIGGLDAVVTHPACAVVASPKGRVAFNPEDISLGLQLVAELA